LATPSNFKRKALITFGVLTLTILLYMTIVKADYSEVFRANILFVTLSLAAVLLSLVVSALRFSFLMGMKLKDSINIWFTSQFISNITPTHSGGEIIRLYVGYHELKNLSKPLTVILSEIYGDVIVPNIIALMFSIYNILVLRNHIFMIPAATSAYNIVAWSLIVLKKKFLRKAVLKILSKLNVHVEEIPLPNGREVLVKNLLLSILFSLVKFVLMGFSVFLAYISVSERISLLNSLLAYSLAMALGIVPLPAGIGGIEAGLSLIRPGAGVIMWRIISYYIATLLMLPFVLTLIHRRIII